MTAISGQSWAWPWVLGCPPALLGGAAGLAALTEHDWLTWAAIPTGLATGIAGAFCLGRAAIQRLRREQLSVLARLAGHGGG